MGATVRVGAVVDVVVLSATSAIVVVVVEVEVSGAELVESDAPLSAHDTKAASNATVIRRADIADLTT